MSLTSFIGIDMAWRIDGNHSGIAVMTGDEQQVRLDAVSADITSMTGVVEYVTSHAGGDAVVSIDASLVVRNETGQRACEAMVAREFGKYHASCHPSNLGRPYARTGMGLVSALEKHGFRHDFAVATAKQRPGRWVLEVYPHPAMVRVFELDRIIPYKKGTPSQKRAGLTTLRRHLQALADGSRGLVMSPKLSQLLEEDLLQLRGRSLKRHEDTLDAIFCAYLAWHCWRWGEERNEMFGTLADGYIVVPRASRPPRTDSPLPGEGRSPNSRIGRRR
jgi:predicted RNase H-like nuclease